MRCLLPDWEEWSCWVTDDAGAASCGEHVSHCCSDSDTTAVVFADSCFLN